MSATGQAGGAIAEESSGPATGSRPEPGDAPTALRRFAVPSSPGITPAPAAPPAVSGPPAEPVPPTVSPGAAPTAGVPAGAVRGTSHEPTAPGAPADLSGTGLAAIGVADPAAIGAAPGSVVRRAIGGPGRFGRERLGRGPGESGRWPGSLTGAGAGFGEAVTGLPASGVRVDGPWALSTVGRLQRPGLLTAGLRRAFDSGVAGTEPFAGRGVAPRWRSTAIVPTRSTLRPAPGLVPMRPLTTPVADRLGPERGRVGSSATPRTGSGSAASVDQTRMAPLRRYAKTGAAGHRTVEGVLGTGTTASTPAWTGAVGGRPTGLATSTPPSRTTPARTGSTARAGVNPTVGSDTDPTAGAGRVSGASASVDRSPAVLAGLPAAISGLPSLRRTPADISAARSAATASVGRLARTSSGVGRRHSGALIRRRQAEAIGAAGAAAAEAASSRPVVTGHHTVTRPATSGDAVARTGIDRGVTSARRSPAATGPVDARADHAPATATGWTVSTPWTVSAGWTAPTGHGEPTRWDMPTSIRRLIPDDRVAYRLPSIGSARTITPARTAAATGRATSNAGDRAAAGIRRITAETASHRSVPSARTTGSDPVVGDRRTATTPPWTNGVGGPATPAEPFGSRGTRGVRRSAASERRVTARRVTDGPPATVPPEPAGHQRTASGEPAGLLLRQAIPPTAVVAAATFSTIRRMPPSPPRGTPRLGSHRLTTSGDRRGPDVPASADPSWSFAAAATVTEAGQRGRTGPTIGARTRGSRSVTLPLAGIGGTATGWPATGDTARSDTARSDTAVPDAADRRLDPASARRPSLLDLVPPSLFDRARAGLAAAGGVPSVDVDQFAVRPPGIAAAKPEGAYVNGSTDDLPAQRQRIAEALTPREWDELVDVIVDRLEDRILDELARRGRRFTPGVF